MDHNEHYTRIRAVELAISHAQARGGAPIQDVIASAEAIFAFTGVPTDPRVTSEPSVGTDLSKLDF